MKEINDVEKPVCDWAKENGWLVRKIMCIGHNKFPDRFFLKDSIVAFIEFKRPGEEPDAGQQHEIAVLQDQGANVDWFDNPELAIDWLRNLDEYI